MEGKYDKKIKRARSNVLAATKTLGVVGVLMNLESQMHSAAIVSRSGAGNEKHWMKLHDILQDARYAFRAECEAHDAQAMKASAA